MRKIGRTIIWPQYLDINRPRRLGRKISKEKAIPLPNVQELHEAAVKLGYQAEINSFSKYPRTWWDNEGNLLIDIMGQNKIRVMIKLAEEIKKLRTIKKAEQSSKKKKKKKKKQ